METPYEALKVSINATKEQIDHAFRARSFLCHPDRYRDDPIKEAQYKYLVNCRDMLKDPNSRETIDKIQRTKDAAERQKKREAKRDDVVIQAAAERQAQRAALQRQPTNPGIQHQGAVKGISPVVRPGPASVSQVQSSQWVPGTSSANANQAATARQTSRGIRPIYRPTRPEDADSPVGRSNARRQAPQRPRLLHNIPAELYEEQAEMRNTVQQSWMPGDDRVYGGN